MPRAHDYNSSPNPKRFYRSREDKIIAGVCGGLAERFGWEPILVRILAVIMLFSTGFLLPVYIVIWMLTPREPLRGRPLSPDEDAFWRGV